MKTKDITLEYSKRDQDLKVHWEAGHKHTALNLLGYLTMKRMHYNYESKRPEFDDSMVDELIKRGYDIRTLKITINKLPEGEVFPQKQFSF